MTVIRGARDVADVNGARLVAVTLINPVTVGATPPVTGGK
jgi:hypothetical protein